MAGLGRKMPFLDGHFLTLRRNHPIPIVGDSKFSGKDRCNAHNVTNAEQVRVLFSIPRL
jgi:hypothetical protein